MQDFLKPEKTIKEFGIVPGNKVADFGAGTGAFSFEAAKILEGTGKVYAVEVQKDMLPRIKNEAMSRNVSNIEIIWGDIEKQRGTKIADNVIDVVMMVNVFFLLPEKDNCAREIYRVLKPGGRVCVVDWSDSFSSMGPVPEMVVRKEDIIARFERFGFKMINNIMNAGDHHYGVVLQKIDKKDGQ